MKNLFFEQKAENIDSELFEKFIQEADGYLNLEPMNEQDLDIPNIQHGKYRDASKPFAKAGLVLGSAYQLTGDQKYAIKMRDLMLHYAKFKKWCGMFQGGKSELNNANFCLGMSAGFNLCCDILTTQQCEEIAEAVYEKGIQPILEEWLEDGTRVHALDTMGHNWWIVCVSQAGLAAVVFHKYLEQCDPAKIAESTRLWFEYKGNPINMKPVNYDNGGFYESLSYLDYALREFCLFKNAYVAEFGSFPWETNVLEGYSNFIVETFYPAAQNSMSVGFGDNGDGSILACAHMMLKAGVDSPQLRWYIKSWKTRVTYVYDVIYHDLIYKKTALSPTDLSAKIWNDIGWAVMRKSYEENSQMLAIKSGDTWNHAHSDNASFIFYNNGKQEIRDSGSCVYELDPYRDYYRMSKAHNVVLFNGKGQDVQDMENHLRCKGALYNLFSDDSVKYVTADASGPMSRYFRRHLRHFLWVSNTILIYDDIQAYEGGTFNWVVHTDNPNSVNILYPKVQLTEQDGYKDQLEPAKYYSFDAVSDQRCKFVAAISYANDEISFDEIENGFRVKIADWQVYINKLSDASVMHKNCINTMDGYKTDAIMLAVKPQEVFMVNASFVRKAEKRFENLYRVTKKVRWS